MLYLSFLLSRILLRMQRSRAILHPLRDVLLLLDDQHGGAVVLDGAEGGDGPKAKVELRWKIVFVKFILSVVES